MTHFFQKKYVQAILPDTHKNIDNLSAVQCMFEKPKISKVVYTQNLPVRANTKSDTIQENYENFCDFTPDSGHEVIIKVKRYTILPVAETNWKGLDASRSWISVLKTDKPE